MTHLIQAIRLHPDEEELQLNGLPDKPVHVAGYSGEDLGVLEFYEVIMDKPAFHHRRSVCMSKPYMVYIDRAVQLIYTWSHSQGMLYTHGVLSPRSPFTVQRNLEIFLGISQTF